LLLRPTSAHRLREHAANDVLVTGTFDDWQKTVTLEKKDGVFTKTVELPKVHTQYKVRTIVHAPGRACRLEQPTRGAS
jgi:hypothetical protein